MTNKKWILTALICTLLLAGAILAVTVNQQRAGGRGENEVETPSETEGEISEVSAADLTAEGPVAEAPFVCSIQEDSLWNSLWMTDRYPAADMSGYDDLQELGSSCFREMETIDVCNEIDNGSTFIVVFSHTGCPHCQVVIPVLNQLAADNGLAIGYVNVRKEPTWNNNLAIDNYRDLVKRVGDYFPLDEFERPHMYVPHVFFISNGEVVSQLMGAFDYDGSGNPLTETQRTMLLDFYTSSLKTIG